ncbi:hypothetical protein LSAT2_006020 [Lamellibrachia satsuma]|nr:hypothetical protein LSAT2_006020 [Lamellibrachia satsuma]
MQELKVPRMTSIDDCVVTHYDTFSAWAPRTPSTCVFMENHGKICKGDSGSPMICQKDGRWTVVAISSWSLVACFGKHIPSVYTNVADFLPWITSVT